jgi:hypothetical protein
VPEIWTPDRSAPSLVSNNIDYNSSVSYNSTEIELYTVTDNKLQCRPTPVAARSKTWVCGRSLAGIVGSNSAGAWISVSRECCALSGRGLCVRLITRPEQSYRVWCVWVWSRSLNNGGPGPLGAAAPLEKMQWCKLLLLFINNNNNNNNLSPSSRVLAYVSVGHLLMNSRL